MAVPKEKRHLVEEKLNYSLCIYDIENDFSADEKGIVPTNLNKD
jgi:hypothetical protein